MSGLNINKTLAADVAEIGSLFSKNCGVKYLLCVVDVFTKYACVKSLEDEQVKTIFFGFIEIAMNQNLSLINYGLIKEETLDDNNILMYLRHN